LQSAKNFQPQPLAEKALVKLKAVEEKGALMTLASDLI
jgi:hypothetical protein